ncbi:MAG: DedA family protein [Deltaproteobacteria bacterium]|jgi:membrane protein YqaA with SNARE-associated domain|nr:DedA family protein [Deltaproteobacteria bacterium]MBW2484159.1 DedA family protein [Deltaproteobacteria bacterium]
MAKTKTPPDGKAAEKIGWVRQIYDKCLLWVQSPYGVWALFFIAVAESSFFPIPPDVFLMVLCIAVPPKSFRYAAICAVGSVLGGMLGYGLGLGFMDTVGVKILEWYGLHDKYEVVQNLYRQYDALAVGAAGFTPLPYKLFTITAGAFKINFVTFTLVSIVSRSARFFLVAAFIYKFGAPVRHFIERYFNLLTIIFFILLIGGFLVVRLFF